MNRSLTFDAVMPGSQGLSSKGTAAYFRLCWGLWRQQGWIEANDVALARFAGVSLASWPAVWDEIRGRFGSRDGGVTHDGVSEAWAQEKARRERANRSSAAGVAARIANRKSAQVAQQVVKALAAHPPTQLVNNQSTTCQPVVDDLLSTRARLNPDPEAEPSLRSGGVVSGSDLLSCPSRSGSGSDAGARDSKADAIRQVFAHYRQYHPRSFPKPTSGAREWARVAARMREGYTADDLCRAIDGYHASPFHCGDNDRQAKYLDLDLIIRDGSHVAKGIEIATAPPVPILTARERRTARAMASILTDHPTPAPEEDSPWNAKATSALSAWR